MITNCLRSLLPAPVLLAATFVALPAAHAAMSDWAVNEGGRMRVVTLSPDADGRLRGALEIEPQPGWITYWREPGQSGIPPQISVSPGGNVRLGTIGYPVPKPITIGSIHEIGYDGHIALPIEFQLAEPGKPATLKLSALIGICKDICIPFQADFSLSLPAESQFLPQEQGVVGAAEASLPAPPTADFSLDRHTLSPDGNHLSLRFTLPDAGDAAPVVYVTGPPGYVFFQQENSQRKGRTFETEITIGKLPKGYDIHGEHWRVLVIDGDRAMETQLAFE